MSKAAFGFDRKNISYSFFEDISLKIQHRKITDFLPTNFDIQEIDALGG
jgi:hypothetical protein